MNRPVLWLLALWLVAAGLAGPLKRENLKMSPGKPVIRYQDVLLDLLGEGRTMLARYLWFKMDTMHEEQDDQGVSTFNQKEVVPLLRMINYLDPYLTDAYDTLAYELYKGYGQSERAMELVEEGLLYSPESFELNFRKAFLAERKGDYLTAFEFARRALIADQDDMRRLASLRTMYRAALRLHDPKTGIEVVDLITRLTGGANPYREQYQRWKKELEKS